MRFIIAVVSLLFACVPYADLREYHYNRPQTPLHVGLAPQPQQQQYPQQQTIILRESFVQPQATAQQYAPAPAAPPTNIVAQSFGNTGTAHIARQSPQATVTAQAQGQATNGYFPSQQYQNSNGGSQVYYHHHHTAGNAATVAAAYYPQQQGHQQYYTPNVNPLTQQQPHQQVQQQSRYVNLPQQQYLSPQPLQQQQYSQQQGYAQAQYQQQHTSGGAASYSAGGHGGGVAGAVASSYYGGAAGGFGGGGTGAAGSFGSSGQSALGAGQTLPLEGKYISQSEAGQLHSYQHQQRPVSDTRPFSRQITTCYPNGQCERVTLGPGQPDQRHQHTVAATRARTVPTKDKCRLIAEANKAQQIAYHYGSGIGGNSGGSSYAGGSYGTGPANNQDQSAGEYPDAIVRPHDRRLFPYSEIVLPNDPYN